MRIGLGTRCKTQPDFVAEIATVVQLAPPFCESAGIRGIVAILSEESAALSHVCGNARCRCCFQFESSLPSRFSASAFPNG